MKHFGKLLLACISLMLMICIPVFAQDNECGINVVFTKTDGTITFSKKPGSSTAKFTSSCVSSIDEDIEKVVIADPMSVSDLEDMFADLDSVKEMDLSNLETSTVYYMSGTFSGCSSLEKLDLSGWDTSGAAWMESMFSGCSNLSTLVLGDKWDTSGLIYAQEMFSGCSDLETIPGLSEWKTSSLIRAKYMFEDCSSIKEVDLSQWNKSKLNVIQGMFCGCSSLETLDVSNWDTEYMEDPQNTFSGCVGLKTITLGEKQQELVAGDMFYTLPEDVYAGPWKYIAKAEGVSGLDLGTILAGSDLFENYDYSQMGGTWTRVSIIDQVDIINIDVPAAGQTLDTSSSSDTENITINNDGAVSWNPDDTAAAYDKEYTASVTVTADDGYIFADTVTATINGQTAVVTRNDDGTLTISYTFPKTGKKYTVTVSAEGNGTASADPASGPAGTEVTLSANANDGWHFKEWQVKESGGGTLDGDTFTIGTGNAQILAVFEQEPAPGDYTVTVTVKGNGTASADPASGPTGTEVTLTARPDEDWEFKEWVVVESGGGTLQGQKAAGASETAVFIIGTADAEIQAVFEKSQGPTPPTPPEPDPMPFFRPDVELPRTGITGKGIEKPASVRYKPLKMELYIPTLNVLSDIVTVPWTDEGYPVMELGMDAGLLEGSALPGSGMAVIAAHNTLNAEEYGPFALLNTLEAGDVLYVRKRDGTMTRFTVFLNEKIAPDDTEALMRAATMYENTLTLLTCEDELPEGGYAARRIVSAK